MNKNRMTIEELKTLTLPVTLECDDGYFTVNYEKITVLGIGDTKIFIKDKYDIETTFLVKDLHHYPSFKQPKRKVKKTRDAWINIYSGCLGGAHLSRFAADTAANELRVACQKVTLEWEQEE